MHIGASCVKNGHNNKSPSEEANSTIMTRRAIVGGFQDGKEV